MLYGTRLKQNYPFLIAVNPITNEWNVVTYPGKNTKEVIYEYQIIQEKLVSNYITNWFTISKDNVSNLSNPLSYPITREIFKLSATE